MSVLDFGIWGDLEKIVWENNLTGIESFKRLCKGIGCMPSSKQW